jgi:hypothetical protein
VDRKRTFTAPLDRGYVAAMKRFLPIGAVIVSGIALALPMILFGFPSDTHDGHYHLSWWLAFSDQLFHGDLYPRWLAGYNGGLGSPSFYFYPPVPYYVASMFRLFLVGASPARLLGAVCALAVVLSGLTFYRWQRRGVSDTCAAIGAIAYMALPYHLVDVYVRGSFGECWAFVWMPAVMFFAELVARDDGVPWGACVGIATTYGLLVATHLPTTLIFSVVPLGYVTWLAAPRDRLRSVLVVGAAMATGVGLAAGFVFPAVLDQKYVSMAAMHVGKFDYRASFFFPGAPWAAHWALGRDQLTIDVFWSAFASVGLGASGWWISRTDGSARRESDFLFAAQMLAFMMMWSFAGAVYRLIPLLQAIQFPWRFSAVASLSACALVARGIGALRPSSFRASLVAMLGFGVFGFQAAALACPLEAERLAKHASAAQLEHEAAKAWDPPEYKTPWAHDALKKTARAFPQLPSGGSLPHVIAGEGQVEVLLWRPRDIALNVASVEGATLEVGQLFFRGWRAKLEDGSSIPVGASRARGLVQLVVPPGSHRIELRLVRMLPETVGYAVSASTFAVVVAFAGWHLLRDRRKALAVPNG